MMKNKYLLAFSSVSANRVFYIPRNVPFLWFVDPL